MSQPKPNTALRERECRVCHRVLPLDRLVTAAGAIGGKSPFCKDCSNKELRERYAQNRDRRVVEMRAYSKSEAGKKARQNYEEANQDKIKARKAVRAYVAVGKFKKANCQECGNATTEFHHTEGYDKPNWFTGIWLCRSCHAKLHRKLREVIQDNQEPEVDSDWEQFTPKTKKLLQNEFGVNPPTNKEKRHYE